MSALITVLSFHLQKATTLVTNGIVQDEFFVSLKMSTYLVAFVVADVKNISRKTNGSLVGFFPLQVLQHPSQANQPTKTKQKNP